MTLTCQVCGAAFSVSASRVKWGRGRSCSRACQYASNRLKLSRPKVAFTCIGCGAVFERHASQAVDTPTKIGVAKYCSRECRDRHRVGLLHPQFIGRPIATRGPNWQAQKRSARSRDARVCQQCGDRGTDVHHIRPFRLFQDYQLANRLENLVTLCRGCHRRADAAFQAAEAPR